jgi:thiol-disulfide isomerase/thioredoxin
MPRPRRIARLAAEVLLVVAIVAGVHAWQSRGLLDADQRGAAPALDLVDLDGHPWSNRDLAGRPAVVYFFAPWCGVCAASSPQLRWFHRWRGDEVTVLLVGLDWASTQELRDYAARHALAMPVLAGDAATGAAFRVGAYPTYYVLDREGRIARRDLGFTTTPGLWLRTLGL